MCCFASVDFICCSLILNVIWVFFPPNFKGELPTKVSLMLLLDHQKQAITHRLTRKQSTVFRHTFWKESRRPVTLFHLGLSM